MKPDTLDWRALIAAAGFGPDLTLAYRNQAIVACLLYGGLRYRELVALTTADLLPGPALRVGGARPRLVSISQPAEALVRRYLGVRPAALDGTDALFLSAYCRRLSADTLRHDMRLIGRRIGVHITNDFLRRSCLAKLAALGIPRDRLESHFGQGSLRGLWRGL